MKKEKNKSAKSLLAVELYELTGEEIGILKSKFYNKEYFDANVLPKYCLDADGFVRDTLYWLQYVEEGDQVYQLFDAGTIDRLLSEEIAQGGLEFLLEGFNLQQMFSKLKVHKFDDFRRILPPAEYIIIELVYSYDREGDSDMSVDIAGFLNNEIDIIDYEEESDEE